MGHLCAVCHGNQSWAFSTSFPSHAISIFKFSNCWRQLLLCANVKHTTQILLAFFLLEPPPPSLKPHNVTTIISL